MSQLALPQVHRLAPYAPVVLRVVLGFVMTAHGWSKLTQMTPAGFGTGMLAGLGLPAPVVLAWVVTLIELVGGLLLIAGLLSRISAGLVALVLASATVLVKLDIGLIAGPEAPLPGAELDLVLIAAAIGVVLLGPGSPSADHAIGLEERTPELTA